jgi:thiamine transport system substrate-binding protein
MNCALLAPAAALAGLLAPAAITATTQPPAQTVTLVAYDSFPNKPDSPLVQALAEFTAATNITVAIVNAGDTGTMVTKAALTAGNPEGDVMWGVDNTFLSAAVNGRVFDGEPIPVDTGDVCVNYDLAYFADHQLAPPVTLDDLLKPEYRDLLVVENPGTSSPGLAFLLATIAHRGEGGWQDYWRALRANGVAVVDTWDIAYYERFSGSGGGDRPMVVSYASSPPAEVVLSDPPRAEAATGVAAETCFHQVEYAGVLRGTTHPDAARRLVEFLVGERFQRELPLTLFVSPVNPAVTLPDVFTRFGVTPANPFTLDPALIEANRATWQDQWTEVVLR